MQNSILVVDDDPFVLDATASLLREEGYHVRVARSGQGALQQAEKMRLLLIDFCLGDMNGLELFDQLVQRTLTNPPVIMISGTLPAQEELTKRAIIGLQKPYDVQLLLTLIEQVLSLRPQSPERVEPHVS